MKRNLRGFTLIELLIVVAIIGIIVSIAVLNLLSAVERAKQKKTMGDMRTFGTALESYNTDFNRYPPLRPPSRPRRRRPRPHGTRADVRSQAPRRGRLGFLPALQRIRQLGIRDPLRRAQRRRRGAHRRRRRDHQFQ
jgi:prepilin-type N-terminal cleavage/methylation domain-containing protein